MRTTFDHEQGHRPRNPTSPITRHCVALLFGAVFSNISLANAEGVISKTRCQLPSNHRVATVEIVMTRGNLFDDTETWAGNGKRWVGDFEIRVRDGRKLLSRTSLNHLMLPEHPEYGLSFWAPKFQLVFRNYRGHGPVDFNLGQYGNSMMNDYRLFTVHANGAITALPFADAETQRSGLAVFGTVHSNSTSRIRVRHDLVTSVYYDNARPRPTCVAEHRKWKGGKFVLEGSEPTDITDS